MTVDYSSNPSNLTFLDCGDSNITVTNIPINISNLTDVSYILDQFNSDYQCGINYYQTNKKSKRDLYKMESEIQPNITSAVFNCGESNLDIFLTNGTNYYDNSVYNCGISYEASKSSKSGSPTVKIPKVLLLVGIMIIVSKVV